jgi:hypothetical protein
MVFSVPQQEIQLESWSNSTTPLGFILKSGESFQFNLQQSYDRLDNPFDLTDSAIIPVGKYHMHNKEFQFSTYQSREIWVQLLYNWGKFNSGDIKTFSPSLGINLSKHFNLRTDYSYNYITLPNANVISNELAQYFSYAFTTKLISVCLRNGIHSKI